MPTRSSLGGFATLSIVAALVACSGPDQRPGPPAPTPSSSEGRVFTLGDIEPDDPVKVLQAMRPLAEHLEVELAPLGIDQVRVKIAPDIATMSEWMTRGEVDLFFDSPYPALIVSESSGASVILRRWKGGVPVYHSVLFARADSGVTELDGLRGKTVAFDDPASTTGFLLPMAILQGAGLRVVGASGEGGGSDGEVSYDFAGDDTVVVEWVLSGRSIAGAVDHLTYGEIPEATRASLRVLAESEPVPRHLVLIRGGSESRIEEAVKSILLELERSESGQTALAGLKSSRFDLPPEGAEQALEPIRQLRHSLVPPP